MFGITEKLSIIAAVAAVSFGGIKHVQATMAKRQVAELQLEEASTRGQLLTCAARITNLQEAAESNASIPDDLLDFDIPSDWLFSPGADPAGD